MYIVADPEDFVDPDPYFLNCPYPDPAVLTILRQGMHYMVKQGLTKLTYLQSLSVTKNVLNILELLYARIVDYTLATFKKYML
jgi:hypothetical protein